jgi:hypothetical protein
MSDCYHINPLQHGGTSQEFRMPPALNPTYAPIDGRGLSEMLLFLEKYASLLNFYDTTNAINGDWSTFLSGDITTILSSIKTSDCKEPVETWYKYADKFDTASIVQLRNYSKTLFDVTFTLLDQVRQWNDRLSLNSSAKRMILNEIMSRLAFEMRNALLYYKTGTGAPNFIDETFFGNPVTEEFHFKNSEILLLNNFKPEWWARYNSADVIADWDEYKGTYLDAHVIDVEIYGDPLWSPIARANYSLSFLKDNFSRIYESWARIVAVSAKYLIESITNFPEHKANNGLVIAFLQLFGRGRDALNTFTARHLDFYYKDVLRITKKSSVLDSAHIVFTAAKSVTNYTVKKGTALFAGKDNTGKELIYETCDDISINKGEIAALKSVFFDPDSSNGGIYSAEIANSADGKGKELDKEDPSWFGFGQVQSTLGVDERTMTEADTGFMVSSPILQLSEGNRTVKFEITVTNDFVGNPLSVGELAGNFDISITGKKGWIILPNISGFDSSNAEYINVDSTASRITIQFLLHESVDPVVNFDSAIHEATYTANWPLAKFLIKKNASASLYSKLSKVAVNSIKIITSVTGAKNCVLHSDAGSIENKSPFMPFGPRPKLGSSFYMGAAEVFRKKLTNLTLHLDWHGTPVTSFKTHYDYDNDPTSTTTAVSYIELAAGVKSFKANCYVLGTGSAPSAQSKDLFTSNDDSTIDTTTDLSFSNLFTASSPNIEEFATFDPALYRGFIKISLSSPTKAFGHDVFSTLYANQVVLKSQWNQVSLPNDPYTPLLKPLTYDYVAEETISQTAYNSDKGQFFHLFPFGYVEEKESAGLVLPFVYSDGVDSFDLQGALYLGIENISINQQLNIYFELSEGSEDSSLDPTGICWSYLSNNEWLPLGDLFLSDSTNGMLGSGIIRFLVPEEMNDENTIMAPGLRWVRAAVKDTYTAYPKMYAVFANSIKATFKDNGNDPLHLAAPLVAGKINKLYNADAAVKKVAQPFDSFDGRTVESSLAYYNRVSERLRHKNRAITIWDYERLLLEEFNELYKVKCLNHTDDHTELAPGSVRIVVIPDMSNKSTGNLFKPSVSNNKRGRIKTYVTMLNCPFVDLQVENPRYEEVRINCQVKFNNDSPDEENINQLKEDVDKFLAPWAFDESRGIDFGGSIHQSQIINFMEHLPYVDYVTDFFLDVFYAGGLLSGNVPEAVASQSRSVLTSQREHIIGTNVCIS